MTYHRCDATESGSGVSPLGLRLASISENCGGTQNLVTYTYLGMSMIVKESHPQVSGGLNLSYGSAGTYAGWDRFGRIVQQLWKNDAGTTVDGYTYTYDRAGNRTARTNTLNSAFSETYSYDGLNRLVDANRNGTDLQDWTLDAVGNWSGFTDGAASQTRTADAANQITGISGSWIDPVYDAAGNMTTMPKAGAETQTLTAKYDAWNRMVELRDGSNALVASYQYDGRGYRTRKTLADGTTYDYYQNDENQTIEIRKNGDADAYECYVFDQRYIDAPVMVYRDTNTDGAGVQSVYVTQEANFDVTGIIDGSTGTVLNRFVFTPYGYRTVYTATWTSGSTDFSLGRQGLMLDSESGLYYNRARYLHTSLGAFTIRDPLGYVDGMDSYVYLMDSPVNHDDPFGYCSRGCANAAMPAGGSFTVLPPITTPPITNPDHHATCLAARDQAWRDPRVRKLIALIVKNDCPIPPINCVCCEDYDGHGFFRLPSTRGYWRGEYETITVCENNHFGNQTQMFMTILHEMIHAYDHCIGVRMGDSPCDEQACREIRADNLSGECDNVPPERRLACVTELAERSVADNYGEENARQCVRLALSRGCYLNQWPFQ